MSHPNAFEGGKKCRDILSFKLLKTSIFLTFEFSFNSYPNSNLLKGHFTVQVSVETLYFDVELSSYSSSKTSRDFHALFPSEILKPIHL